MEFWCLFIETEKEKNEQNDDNVEGVKYNLAVSCFDTFFQMKRGQKVNRGCVFVCVRDK